MVDTPARQSLVARLLNRVGGDTTALARARLSAVRRILLFGLLAENLEAVARRPDVPDTATIAFVTGIGFCALAVWRKGWGRLACAIACLVTGAQLAANFPVHANHHVLIFICLAVLAGLDGPSEDEPVLAVQSLRWIIVIGFFWAGLQKVLYGYYFGGELLAYAIAETDRFAALFQWVLTDPDFVRLRSDALREAGGPFRVDSALFRTLSNASYLGEIAVALSLLWQRTRTAAAVAGIGLIAAIEAGAREVFFGSLMVNLLLLYFPANWSARALPGFILFYLVLIATALGWLPEWEFT